MDNLSFKGSKWDASYPSLNYNISDYSNLDKELCSLLSYKGVSPDESESFLKPSLKDIHDPALLKNCTRASKLIQDHLISNSSICIYGDFDVDGTCSTTILKSFLEELKSLGLSSSPLDYYIPDRFKEGYGLNNNAIDLLSKSGTKLIITVDCGVSNLAEIDYAKSLGIDVIVLDHHQVESNISDDYIIVNPHQEDCDFPYKNICAAAVTFLTICNLRRLLRDSGQFDDLKEPDLKKLLDLVALATVADVMPLTKLNRCFVTMGLKELKKSKRKGIKALFDRASKDISLISSSDFGFFIGPRINSCGRLKHASTAVDLLLSDDDKECLRISTEIEDINQSRKDVQLLIEKESLEILSNDPDSSYVIVGEGWNQGVLGVVAGRIKESTGRPVILLTKTEEGLLKGSARSVNGYDLFSKLSEVKDYFIHFGGHAMACGMTLDPSKLSDLRTFLEAELKDLKFDKTIRADLHAYDNHFSKDFYNMLQLLEPFGKGNPAPLLYSSNMKLTSKRIIGQDKSHMRLSFQFPKSRVLANAIAFSFAEFDHLLNEEANYDILWKIDLNHFMGKSYLQMVISDIRMTQQ